MDTLHYGSTISPQPETLATVTRRAIAKANWDRTYLEHDSGICLKMQRTAYTWGQEAFFTESAQAWDWYYGPTNPGNLTR